MWLSLKDSFNTIKENKIWQIEDGKIINFWWNKQFSSCTVNALDASPHVPLLLTVRVKDFISHDSCNILQI